MKVLDAAFKAVLTGAVLLWAINQPVGCAEARPTPQSPAPPPRPGPAARDPAVDDALRRIDEAIARLDAAIAAAGGKPAPASARALGARYRADVQAAHLAALEAVAGAPEGSAPADLIELGRGIDQRGRTAAWMPVAAEMGRRLGDPGKADPAAVRAFYAELVQGWKEAGK